ncbi:translation initiation factor eIF3 core subunit c [Aspergillus clavatus NRRL 1]|uniref:Eukaryotic translation initiation factor 3 subunit C n=1 Tax=Aspergillus clavatus (strain ATCC 1007 / CBS 513.65 / DSM 816 / NCTC 3887 / NRRL 1 / QM 1276 / 107) TaxID=344612 RepID=EIF3C_ASPCL|nr:eukaryotic translation initiation factor 3 subunit EifCc, putative [Aspergillus clavatus NRRL 1]A1C987.1 RecName: Full=Eukaryotic translation initiation factor 3 subunit C; Short=eIF3c; AltName: Full=Eukaryotic translation initiation factor 3 93 kDa subunit homolog; Short=eIF3 p93; AltName: Full=Translation initiation factor eIF3, p93 subunit homolog [Aspergillus clavatus NRRL 1]EAW13411.1 eukaryotic translation initiation factor 3 subunit EifCc, putative [Aspergillus clavatus NRRL 1]
MSRFFYGGGSDSESSSSDEEELYERDEEEQSEEEESSEEEETSEEGSDDEEGGVTGAARFMRDMSESEESEDEEKTTVVKSAKDKRLEELESTMKLIDNAKKINDWAVISTEFDKLNRQIVKITQAGPTPRVYIKGVADLEDFVNETVSKQKSGDKKLNASNAKGFNAVKQRIKKNNKDYANLIDKYRKNKEAFLEGKDEAAAPAAAAPRVAKLERVEAPVDVPVADDEGFATVGRGGKTLQYTPESILKHLRVIVESRGKKNTDRLEQIRTMEKLLEVAQNPYQRIRVYLTLISTRFDLTSTSSANYMAPEMWKSAEQDFSSLLSVLENNRDYVVTEGVDEWEDDEKQPQVAAGETLYIPGSVVSYAERLDDELTRSLQHIDPHTAEYIERLSDEKQLYTSLVRAQAYVEGLSKAEKSDPKQDSVNRVVMRRLEHVYFKPSQVITILEDATWKALPSELDSGVTPRGKTGDVENLVLTLCNYLFQYSDGIIRARAMLCQIYFLALHDQYYRARDLMLMSHLTENISNFDVSTQILFNRTLVQIGLCAFRAGLIYEAQNTLSEVCGSGRQKELLAQGIILQRYSTVSPEQERLERQRQLPFHMHINLELLECIYLTSSMFLEVPLMAQTSSSPELKRRVISKTFRRMLDYNERQVFTGPAENTRDGVIMSAKFLAAGDWKKAAEMLNSIKIWELMPQPEKIKEMLSQQIQEEGLRTYLFTYAPFYDSVSVATLASMFELSEKKISAIISRMISHEELAAALDQVNGAIVFRKGVELSRLQSQIVTLADKSMALLEGNEKTLEQRTQGMANAFQRDQGAGARGGRGGGRGGHARGGARFPGQQGRRPGGQQFGGGALGGAIKA